MIYILNDKQCPRCGGKIQRIRRTRFDRFLSIFVSVQRYQCEEPTCHWSGLIKFKSNQKDNI
jgi:hypothetical protein